MKASRLTFSALALGLGFTLVLPGRPTQGFTVLGGDLSAESQRDFRIRNNFADAQANNYQTPESQFPGWQGADQALWKAAVEWGSILHGDGSGTPGQSLGDGGANFDFAFMGRSAGAGGSNDNIVSAIGPCQSGVLAFVQTPIVDGWTMKFCDNQWVWADGPGQAVGVEKNIQGVGTHEFGHSLGLGHSQDGTAVMRPSTFNGNENRDLKQDDKNGVQFIYAPMLPTKPIIDGASYCGGTVTITGSNFSATGNQVWFTNETVTSNGSDPRVIVNGVASQNGGTLIEVAVPADAGPGDVLVKIAGVGHSTLSNAWPLDPSDSPASHVVENGLGVNAVCFSETSGAIIGANWQTTVAFKPEDDRSAVVVSTLPNCHEGGFSPGFLNGTELLIFNPLVKPFDVTDDGIHSIPVPDDCNMIGREFCTQAFTVRFGPVRTYGLNALRITIGDS